MSNYGWFSLKMMVFLTVIGYVCYLTNSATPLWALLLTPSYSDTDKTKED